MYEIYINTGFHIYQYISINILNNLTNFRQYSDVAVSISYGKVLDQIESLKPKHEILLRHYKALCLSGFTDTMYRKSG